MSAQVELQVADRFPVGSKVGVFPRVHDFFTPGQTKAVGHATVSKDGSVALSGLVEHGPYFLAAEVTVERPSSLGQVESKEWRAVAFTASNAPPAESPEESNAQAAREADAAAEVVGSAGIATATAPGGASTAPKPVIEGARDTSVLATRIEGVKPGTPLASDTETGEAIVLGEPKTKARKAATRKAAKARVAKKAKKK